MNGEEAKRRLERVTGVLIVGDDREMRAACERIVQWEQETIDALRGLLIERP